MKRKPIAALLLASAGAAHAGPPASNYGLAWEETFSGTTLDTSRWNYRTDVKKLSAQRPANVAIVNNQLSLLMKRESYAGKEFTGGGIVTKQVFGYGYYEVSSRTTNNDGWHNSFWMMRGDGSDTFGANRYLEIDSAEIDTQRPSTISAGLMIWNGTAGEGSLIKGDRCPNPSPTFDSSAAFHTYGVDWREGAIDFYIDGTKYCTKSYPTNTYRQDPINIWLTALGYEAPVTVGGTPQLYDNVRFYKKDQYVLSGYYGYGEGGSGWAASTVAGFGLMPQRYSCDAGAAATYSPGFQQAGNYRVYMWKTVQANSDTATAVTITANGNTTSRTVDGSAGSSGWVDLGQYYFGVGTSGSVRAARANGCLRASAVKFVRV